MIMYRVDFPNLLITTGYWDIKFNTGSQLKWIAKIREYRTNKNLLLMYCNMDVVMGVLQVGLKV